MNSKLLEGMFAGAREKTGAITSEESIEVRKERYAAMINHFCNLRQITWLLSARTSRKHIHLCYCPKGSNSFLSNKFCRYY